MTQLLADAGDTAEDPIPVAIETPRGLMVAALRACGRPVFAINPMAVARYRERHSVARAKSDHADAMTLANILRVDAHLHRRLPADSELAQAIAVLARAQQDAVWRRTKAGNELRSLLREYYPAFLDTFAARSATNLAKPEARAVLAIAPTPAAAGKLTKTRVAAALRRAGRKRGIDQLASEIVEGTRSAQLRQPGPVEQAMGRQALALLAMLDAACEGADELEQAAAEQFRSHPDYAVITSFPGLADLTGARMLAELGDDRRRFADARALKAYAGSAPVTRASGKSISITHRRIKNDRLAAVGWIWGTTMVVLPGPAQQHYRHRRDHGDRHAPAVRHLFNKMLGQLYHCLHTHQTYDPTKAFGELAKQVNPGAGEIERHMTAPTLNPASKF
ncbi:IS110 family transposase [Nocardia sp. SC052]|uniref:IS110 family transposase n=1 Tax=Nocardia sichangensis TaxID=3385975 RepID=UPI0039A216F9